jgi:hypothetical protein
MKMGKALLESDWLVVFRPEPDRPDGPNAAQRMRQLLKYALRSQGLRCLRVAPGLPAELPAPDPALDVTRTEPPFVAGHEEETSRG